MPRYDYRCRVCQEVAEAITSYDQKEILCPVCNTGAIADRQVSAPANIHIH